MMYRICRGIGAFGSGTETSAIGTSFMAASVVRTDPERNRKPEWPGTPFPRRASMVAGREQAFSRGNTRFSPSCQNLASFRRGFASHGQNFRRHGRGFASVRQDFARPRLNLVDED